MTSAVSEWNCPEVDDLTNQIGSFIQYWGFKKIHGRIWATLYLSKDPLDATEIRQRLKISKALVSLSVRDLIQNFVIEEIGKSSRGTILYRANPSIRRSIVKIIREREKVMLSKIVEAQSICEKLGLERLTDLGIEFDRLRSVGNMSRMADEAIDSLIQSEKQDLDPGPALAVARVVSQMP